MPKRREEPVMTPCVYPDRPFLWGGDCDHCVSVRLIFNLSSRPLGSPLSYTSRVWWPAHGAHLRLWSNLGAPRERRKMRRASWRAIRISLLRALFSSFTLASSEPWRAGLGDSGAPSKEIDPSSRRAN